MRRKGGTVCRHRRGDFCNLASGHLYIAFRGRMCKEEEVNELGDNGGPRHSIGMSTETCLPFQVHCPVGAAWRDREGPTRHAHTQITPTATAKNGMRRLEKEKLPPLKILVCSMDQAPSMLLLFSREKAMCAG